MRTLRTKLSVFWFTPASPVNLAVCRILFFGGLLLLYLGTDFSSWGVVSEAFWIPIPLFQDFGVTKPSLEVLEIGQTIWRISLLFACIGLFTKPSTIVALSLGLYLLGVQHSFGGLFLNDPMVVMILAIFAMSRCGDALSADRKILPWRRTPATEYAQSLEYQWPVRLAWVFLAFLMAAAGFAKLRHSGLGWVFSDYLKLTLIKNQYNLPYLDPLTEWGLILAQYECLCVCLAAGTLILELAFPLALFSRRARIVLVPSAIVMLIGFRLLVGPSFMTLILCQVFFVPWDRLLPTVLGILRDHGSAET